MDYIKIRFGSGLEGFSSELEKTIGEIFQSVTPAFTLSPQRWKPQMDIYETPTQIILLAMIAGVLMEDLVVELDSNAVRISGKRMEAQRGGNVRFHLAEVPYGPFERTLYLPAPIDPEKVTASYTNGMLQIRMAKKVRKAPLRLKIKGL